MRRSGMREAAIALVAASFWADGCGPGTRPPARPAAAATLSAEAAAEIREIVAAASHGALRHSAFPYYKGALQGLYEPVAYAPVWFDGARLRHQASEAIALLHEANTRGLPTEDYDVARLDEWRAAAEGPGFAPREIGRFDAALSLLYMRHLSDVRIGRINPKNLGIGFDVEPKKYVLQDVVRDAIASSRVREMLTAAEPALEQYVRLKAALARYRELSRDAALGQVPVVRKLAPGDAYDGAEALARRLAAFGDLPPAARSAGGGESGRYTGPLVEALKRFQERHDLTPDGVVGAGTFARLNLGMDERVRLIELALERLRWLRVPESGPLIVVNIAGYRLWTFDLPEGRGTPTLTMRIVVGRALRYETPVFDEQLRYLVFRPYWNIPPSILRNETLPAARRDPGYLAAQEMEIVDGDRDDSPVVADTPENLAKVRPGGYRIRQRPGPRNALGRVKFIFPNNANVYLHDTPSQGGFARDRRDLSHGCVRVANPVALAEWALGSVPGWTRERIEKAMAAAAPQQVNPKLPIPVLLFYSTVIVDAAGQAAFFEDIYGHDRKLDELLKMGEPYAP